MRSNRTILVTGGAGFIGSHLVERLLGRGDSVVVVDDLSTGSEDNLGQARAAAPDRLRFLRCTVCEAALRDDLGRLDGVHHLAAAVGVRRVMERPVESLETNVQETSAAVRIALRARCPLLLASSSEVYGKASKLPFGEEDDVVYGPTSVTRWSYGCSKALDEYMGLAAHREHGLPVVVARIFNTVGPRQIGRWGMVLPRFVAAALAERPVEVHGDGAQSRCFADVRDVSAGLERLLDLPSAAGRVFNIGADRSITIRALAELVVARVGSASPIVHVPYASAFGEGFEDLRARQPDLARIRQAIGFQALVPLERTIDDMVALMRASGRRESAA